MSTVCVLTPVVIGSWPMIATAVASAAAAMGFSVVGSETAKAPPAKRGKERVEALVPNSEVIAEVMARGETVRIERDGVTIEFGVDERGACRLCVTGDRYSKKQLRQIGEEVSGRVVQQFAYHKLMTELKKRNFDIVEEQLQRDDSIQVRVRQAR